MSQSTKEEIEGWLICIWIAGMLFVIGFLISWQHCCVSVFSSQGCGRWMYLGLNYCLELRCNTRDLYFTRVDWTKQYRRRRHPPYSYRSWCIGSSRDFTTGVRRMKSKYVKQNPWKWLYENFPDWEKRSTLKYCPETLERRWHFPSDIEEAFNKEFDEWKYLMNTTS